MLCKKCGRLNDDNNNFCSNCGQKLEKEDLFTFNSDAFKVEAPNYDDILGYNKKETETKEEIKTEEIKETPIFNEKKIEEINIIKEEKPLKKETKNIKIEEPSFINGYKKENIEEPIIKRNIDESFKFDDIPNDNIDSKKNKNDSNDFVAEGTYHSIELDANTLLLGQVFSIIMLILLNFFFIVFFILLLSGVDDLNFEVVALNFLFIGLAIYLWYNVLTYKKRKSLCLLANYVLKNGEPVVGTIRKTKISHNKYNNTYYIEYAYHINGTLHVSHQKVSLFIFKKLDNGTKIDVKIGNGLGVFDQTAFLNKNIKHKEYTASTPKAVSQIKTTKLKYITNSFGETIAIPEEQDEVVYVDDEGNEYTKEEVEALNLDIIGYDEDK